MSNTDNFLQKRVSRGSLLRAAGTAGAGALALGPAAAFAQNVIFTSGGPGMGSDVLAIASLYATYISNHDAKGLASIFADTFVGHVWPLQQTLSTPAQEVASAVPFIVAFPDLKATITNSVVQDDKVAQQLVFTGTQTGPLATAAGTIPASGKSVVLPAAAFFTVAASKIVTFDLYFDLLTLLAQIGAAPK